MANFYYVCGKINFLDEVVPLASLVYDPSEGITKISVIIGMSTRLIHGN